MQSVKITDSQTPLPSSLNLYQDNSNGDNALERSSVERRRSKIPIKRARNVLESSEEETSSKSDNKSSTCSKQLRRKRSKIPVIRKTALSSGSDASDKIDSSGDDASVSSKSSDIERSSANESTEVSVGNAPTPCSNSLDDAAGRGLEPTGNEPMSFEYEMSDCESSAEDSDNDDTSSPKNKPSKRFSTNVKSFRVFPTIREITEASTNTKNISKSLVSENYSFKENGVESARAVKQDAPKLVEMSDPQARIQELEEKIAEQKQNLDESSKKVSSLEDKLYCLNYEYKVVERRAKYFENDAARYKEEVTQMHNTHNQNTTKEKNMKQKIMELSEINRELKSSSKQSASSLNELIVYLQKVQYRIIDMTKHLADNEQEKQQVDGDSGELSEISNYKAMKNVTNIKCLLERVDAAIDDLNERLLKERQASLPLKQTSDDHICKLRDEIKHLNEKLQNKDDKELELKAMDDQLNLLQEELHEKEACFADREQDNELKNHGKAEKIAYKKLEQLKLNNNSLVQQLERQLAQSMEHEMQKNGIIKEMVNQIKEMQASSQKATHDLENTLSEKANFEKEFSFDGVGDLDETIELLTEEKEQLTRKNKELLDKLANFENDLEKNIASKQQFSRNTIQELKRDLSERANFEKELIDGVGDLEKTIELLSKEKRVLMQTNEELLKKLANLETDLRDNKANNQLGESESELQNATVYQEELQSRCKCIDNTIQDLNKGLSSKDEVIQTLVLENNQYIEKQAEMEFQLKNASTLVDELQKKVDFDRQDFNGILNQALDSKHQQISQLTSENQKLMKELRKMENKLKHELYKKVSVRDRQIEALIAENHGLLKRLFELDEKLKNASTPKIKPICGFKLKQKLSTKDRDIDSLKAQREGLMDIITFLENKYRKLNIKVIELQQELFEVADRPVNGLKREKYTIVGDKDVTSLEEKAMDIDSKGKKQNRSIETIV